jgi:hypothetical protein
MVVEKYSLEAVLPAMLQMYDEAIGTRPRQYAPPPVAQPSVQSHVQPARPRPDVLTIPRQPQPQPQRQPMKSSPFRG